MSWRQVPLSEICQIIMGQAPVGSSYNENGKGYALIAGAGDFGDIIPEPKKYTTEASKISQIDDLIICIRATIGDLNWSDKKYCLGRGVAGLRPNSDCLDRRYLWHFIESNKRQLSAKGTGSTFKQVSRSHIAEWQIPLPPLPEQKRIAAILDKADAIRRKRQQAIQLADEFLRAVFLDMFGDPVTNPKGWEVGSLSEYGSFKNGLNFGKDEHEFNVRYLGVGDFKSRTKIEGVESLTCINLSSLPSDEYYLKDGDIVFVRSNGNKALVGRCISVYPGPEKVTFSGFCIRFRIKNKSLDTAYLNYLFRTPSIKHAMLKGGQGANIQNINQKILSAIPIPIPPVILQSKFSSIVSAFDLTESKNLKSDAKLDSLFNSISQKAFSGQL